MKATDIDKAIKNFDNSLVMWQRLALAEIFREWVRLGNDDYTIQEFLTTDEYGTLAERAEWQHAENHGVEFCAPMSCLTCGARRA
jgi:hypothetical protein